MSTITKTFRFNLVLTNMTSVKLSDITGTFGIKRNDTDAVVVADNTTMTNSSTGVYTHTFADPANDLVYTYALEYVFQGETYHVEETFPGPVSGAATESGLSLTYTDLLGDVGHYLGYGRDTGAYSAAQTADCDAAVQSGYRQFLNPPLLQGRVRSHVWSFLSPLTTLSTASGTTTYNLPNDFGSLVGIFTVSSDKRVTQIRVVGEGEIRRLQQMADTQGFPELVAIIPKAFAPATGQRWEIEVWPDPDSVYTIQYRYNLLQGVPLSGTNYPTGGLQHAETIRAFCLAAAERSMNDEKGIWWDRAMERLATSISVDGEMTPDTLGYNGDFQFEFADRRNRVRAFYSEYEGVIYGPNAP